MKKKAASTFYFCLLLSILFPAGRVFAQNASSCAHLMRHNLIESIKDSVSGVSRVTAVNEICSTPLDAKKKEIPLFNGSLVPAPSPLQLRQMKKVLCSGVFNEKDARLAVRQLTPWIGQRANNSYRTCLALQKKGIPVFPKVGGDRLETLNVSFGARAAGFKIKDLEIVPENSFTCEGSAARFEEETKKQKDDLVLSCNRTDVAAPEGSSISLVTSAGKLNFDFAPYDPAEQIDYSAFANLSISPVTPLPTVAGCQTADAANRVLVCDNANSWTLCYQQMMRGTVVNCRSAYASTVFPNVREVQVRPEVGEYQRDLNGRFRLTVTRGARGSGTIDELVNYTINFDTPEPPERPVRLCDPDCPICDERTCERRCNFADHVLELEDYFGVAFIGRSAEPSCETAVSRTLPLSDYHKFYAYNLCELQQAWGSFIEGTYLGQVSKFYRFQDARTTRSQVRRQRGGRQEVVTVHEILDAGERYRAIAELELPIQIACRQVS